MAVLSLRMVLARVARGIGVTATVGAVLFLASLFVGDRQLTSPFDEVQLEPVAVPVGMPLAAEQLLFSSDESGSLEIYSQGLVDGTTAMLTDDSRFESWRPRLSPDRSTIMFYRTPAGDANPESDQASLWMMTAQGTELVEVLPPGAHGWDRQGGAEWSPVGSELVMMGVRQQDYRIWVTTPDGRGVRALVSDRGQNTDPSWGPLGERVLYVGCPDDSCELEQREVFAIQSGGGERIQITSDEVADSEPRFSPDGTQIATRSLVVRGDDEGNGDVWDIRVLPTNRSREPRRLVGDDSVSGSPVWLDAETVAFDRTEQGSDHADIVSVRVAQAVRTVLVDGPADQIDPAPG